MQITKGIYKQLFFNFKTNNSKISKIICRGLIWSQISVFVFMKRVTKMAL